MLDKVLNNSLLNKRLPDYVTVRRPEIENTDNTSMGKSVRGTMMEAELNLALSCTGVSFHFVGQECEEVPFEETAKRELKEETGLDLVKIIDIMPPTYSAVGVSNEKTVCVVCEADGVIGGNPEEDEDIEAFWVDKNSAKKLLYDSDILLAARTQMLLYQWINSDKIFRM